MASLNEIVFSILDAVRHGRGTNNEYIDERLIEYYVKQYRALLIRRDTDRLGDLGASSRLLEFEQTLPEVKFQILEEYEIGALGSPMANNPVLRTSSALPTLVRLKNYPALTFVGPTDLHKNYTLVSYHALNWKMRFSKYTWNQPYSFLLQNFLYIANPDDTGGYFDSANYHLYTVRGIFEDPLAAAAFGGIDLTRDSEYPVPIDFAQRVAQSIMSGEMSVLLNSPNDTILNTLPDESNSTS